MVLDIGSLMFNINVNKGGTPSWGTEMGQGEGYKFNFEDYENFITAMTYTIVSDTSKVNCPLGKGGSRADDYQIVLASLFKKVFVNNQLVPETEFLLLIVKQIYNTKGFHIGRMSLKYNPNMTYDNEKINEKAFKSIREFLDLNEDSAWFVYEITTKNQDELHLKVFVLDKDKPLYFENSRDRKAYILNNIVGGIPTLDENNSVGENILVYGVPGSGKSYYINQTYAKNEDNIERVVFHPEYSYSDFVGQIKPKLINNNVEYRFTEGPFVKILRKAYKNPNENFYLIIEEINRGNAPLIFGDIFQLLDRDEYGNSIYSITNFDISQAIFGNDVNIKIKIPKNLNIIASMNTSDQNVFTLDTAFKRRWKMKMIENDIDKCTFADIKILDTDITWRRFVEVINKLVIENNSMVVSNEDKRIGIYFLEEQDLNSPIFAEKILAYLWDDVFKYNREEIFNTDKYASLEMLIKGFNIEKFNVFKINF